MRPFTSTIPFADALRLALDAVTPVSRIETVALADADGRVVARDVTSPMDVPPFDRSAMDGYAVRSDDFSTPHSAAGVSLVVAGRIFTGEFFAGTVSRGTCVEISTGAPMPEGADAVVMVEDTTRVDDTHVVVRAHVTAGQNIGRRAADIRQRAAVVRTGQLLTPSRVGALAAVGFNQVDVCVRPSVAIVSTGNEVVQPGLPLPPGHIYDINRFTLSGVVSRHGGVAVPLASAVDTLDALERTLDAAAQHDLIVFSGGSSVGDHDLVRDVIATRGDMLFHGIAVKPGKPTACARIGSSLFFGMPGNPTSCLSNAYILLLPVLRKLAGLPAWEPMTKTVALARAINSASDRHQFYTVRVVDDLAEPAFKGSGDITSMADADGYIEIPAGTASLASGTRVVVTLF